MTTFQLLFILIIIFLIHFQVIQAKQNPNQRAYRQKRRNCSQKTCPSFGYYQQYCVRLCISQKCAHQILKTYPNPQLGQNINYQVQTAFKQCCIQQIKATKQ